MTYRQRHLANYFNEKPDDPPKFSYNCSYCGEKVDAGIDRCPKCQFPYLQKTHTHNVELEMVTKWDRGISQNEILSQILRNQMHIMEYIREKYGKDWVVRRLMEDDITRTEYMRMYLDGKI